MRDNECDDVLTINCELVKHQWIVRLCGELDRSSSELLFDAAMMGRDRPDVTEVVVDFTGVTFVDPSGLHALATVHIALASSGRSARVEGASGHISEIMHLTGLAELFEIPSWDIAGEITDSMELSREDV